MVNIDLAHAPEPQHPPHEDAVIMSSGARPPARSCETFSILRTSSRRRSLSEATGSLEARGSRRGSRFLSLSSSADFHHSASSSMPRITRFSSRTVIDEPCQEEEKREDGADKEEEEEEEEPTTTTSDEEDRPRAHSDGSLTMGYDGYDDSLITDDSARDFGRKRRAPSTASRQRYIFGRPLPLWCTTKPKATSVATFLAKYAPCFWCSKESLSLTTTNRAILLRLNALTAFFALVQIASAAFVCVVVFSDQLLNRNAPYVNRGRRSDQVNSPNLWSMNSSVMAAGCLAFFTFVGMICSRTSLREIDLPGSIRFMWFLLWIIPIQVYLFVSLFDYHHVTDVWIRHWWTARSSAWYRSKSCALGSYNTLCVVPIDGLPLFSSEEEWCLFYYNSTACERIRHNAQTLVSTFSYSFYTMNAVLGIVVFLLLVLIVKVLEGVITRPLVQKSRERNIPMWLLLPFAGCLATGCVLLFSPSSILKINNAASAKSWPGIAYIVAATLYSVAALLGYCISKFAILNTSDKRTKTFLVTLFILVMLATICAMAAIFVGSLMLSTRYVDNTLNDSLRGKLACSISAGSCSYCDNDRGMRECPEWTESDVAKVVKTQLKQSATLAALFMFYSLGTLRFGITLRAHISLYQIDYV